MTNRPTIKDAPSSGSDCAYPILQIPFLIEN